MNEGDAQPLCILCIMNRNRVSIQANGTLVQGNNTSQHIHQRGFARTVFTQNSADLARLQGEVYRLKRMNSRVVFVNALHFKEGPIPLHICHIRLLFSVCPPLLM